MFRDVAAKVATRPGGYTRILKTGNRIGDNAEMCMIELVDYNEFITTETKAASDKKVTRRSRGGAKKQLLKQPTQLLQKILAKKKVRTKRII